MNVFKQGKVSVPQEVKVTVPTMAQHPNDQRPDERFVPQHHRTQDLGRDSMASAVEVYDRLRTQNGELEARLRDALRGLEQKNLEIESLQLSLKEAKNEIESYRKVRDEAANEMMHWRALVASIKALMDRFDLPLLPPPRRLSKSEIERDVARVISGIIQPELSPEHSAPATMDGEELKQP